MPNWLCERKRYCCWIQQDLTHARNFEDAVKIRRVEEFFDVRHLERLPLGASTARALFAPLEFV